MGKRGGANNSSNVGSGSRNNRISLREEATGKIHMKPATNLKSNLRIEHLRKLAVWATSDTPIPSLGAFYGQHLATVAEAAGVPPDPSLTTCQRCETVLHPGFNCTVRIEKNRSRVRRRNSKSGNITQNNIVYNCNFCLHKNLKKGTPKGHLKGICPSKGKSSLELTPTKPIRQEPSKFDKGTVSKDNEVDVVASQVAAKDNALVDVLATPPSTSMTTLPEGKKKRKNSSTSKKAIETASLSAKVEEAKPLGTASKRRRKSWTSLKDIVKNKEHDNSQVVNVTIPFFL